MKKDTIKFFTAPELRKIFRTIEKDTDKNMLRNLCAFHIFYYTGCRASEIGLLKLGHYNKQTGELYVTRLKGSISNTIRLDETRKKILNKYIREYNITDSSAPLFISRLGRAFSGATMTYLCSRYLSQIPSIPEDKKHPHAFRHTCCKDLGESGLDVKEIQYFVGHARITSTEVYFRFTTKQYSTMYQKFSENSVMVE